METSRKLRLLASRQLCIFMNIVLIVMTVVSVAIANLLISCATLMLVSMDFDLIYYSDGVHYHLLVATRSLFESFTCVVVLRVNPRPKPKTSLQVQVLIGEVPLPIHTIQSAALRKKLQKL